MSYVLNPFTGKLDAAGVTAESDPLSWLKATAQTGLTGDKTGQLNLNIGTGTLGAGAITGTSIIKSGGTTSQFLKANGDVDSNTYLTTLSGAWLNTTDQTNLTGDKSGSFDLATSGRGFFGATARDTAMLGITPDSASTFHLKLNPLSAFDVNVLGAISSSGAGIIWTSPNWLETGNTQLWFYNGDILFKLNTLASPANQFKTFYDSLDPLGIGYRASTPIDDIPAYFAVKNVVSGAGTISINPGTVTTTNGSAVVTGVGTQFTKSFDVAAGLTAIRFTGIAGGKVIASVDSDTQITLTANLTTSRSGITYYNSMRVIGSGTSFTTQAKLYTVIKLIDSGVEAHVDTIDSDTLITTAGLLGGTVANKSGVTYQLINPYNYAAFTVAPNPKDNALIAVGGRLLVATEDLYDESYVVQDDGVSALQVGGAIAVYSAGVKIYTLPVVDGTTGQKLTTNGSGALYWS